MLYTNFVWERLLTEGEKIKYEFSIGLRYRIIGFIIWILIVILVVGETMTAINNPLVLSYGVIFGAALIIFGIFYFLFYLRIANMFAFTDRRVIIHRGWLWTNAISIDYDKITDMVVKERFFERLIMGTGDLLLDTAGTGEFEIVLSSIADPYAAKKRLEEIKLAKK